MTNYIPSCTDSIYNQEIKSYNTRNAGVGVALSFLLKIQSPSSIWGIRYSLGG